MDDRDHPDDDPGDGYVVNEPAFAIIRERLVPGATVLDIGCGHGNVGRFLSASGAVVDGIEPDRGRSVAASAHLNHVCATSLADAVGSSELREAYDVVLLLDVVEHVISPLDALHDAMSFMADDSRMFLFVPNSAHWSFRKKMLRGNWAYQDWGLFDRTHLRFFDLSTSEALCRSAGLAETHRWCTTPGQSRVNHLAARSWPRLHALHFLFELRKA